MLNVLKLLSSLPFEMLTKGKTMHKQQFQSTWPFMNYAS